MEITIRNLTKDVDKTINFPMETERLTELLGNDEWIIIDSPVGEELTNITKLNEIVTTYNEVFITTRAAWVKRYSGSKTGKLTSHEAVLLKDGKVEKS